jgi:hypothetical protein
MQGLGQHYNNHEGVSAVRVPASVHVYMHGGEGYLVFAIRANFTKRLEAMQKLFLLLWQQRFVRVCCVAHLSCADQGSGFRL